jgi:nicotinate phosphoribosyltransferase
MSPNSPPPLAADDLLNVVDPDLTVTLEFMAEQDGVLGGLAEVLAFLRALQPNALQVWMLEPGARLQRGDVVLRVRGLFHQVGIRSRALAGILATTSGWTTAARALVEAAKPAPVLFRGATTVHPAVITQLEQAAVAGGCLGSTAEWNRGLMARELVLLMGDTVRALRALDAALPPEIPRLTYVDLFHDEADEAVRVALAFGNKLGGVVLRAETSDAELTLELARRVRAQLELAGFPRVKLFLDGTCTPHHIAWWKSEHAPLDGYFVGDQIGAAPPLPFAVELRESAEKPLGRRGQTPGTTPSLRLQRVNLEQE